MSMPVGGSSDSLAYLHSLLQRGAAGADGAANSRDPQSDLLSPISGSSSDSNLTAPPTGGTTSSGVQQFGACMMDEMLKMQGQAGSGAAGSGGQQSGSCDMSALLGGRQTTSGGAAQSSSELFPQLGTDGSTATAIPVSSTDNSTSSDGPSIQSSANLLDQLMQLQSQLQIVPPPTISSFA